MTPCLPLFPGFGVLQRRTPAYYRIHAALVENYRASKSARLSKRQRAEIRHRIIRQTSEVLDVTE